MIHHSRLGPRAYKSPSQVQRERVQPVRAVSISNERSALTPFISSCGPAPPVPTIFLDWLRPLRTTHAEASSVSSMGELFIQYHTINTQINSVTNSSRVPTASRPEQHVSSITHRMVDDGQRGRELSKNSNSNAMPLILF